VLFFSCYQINYSGITVMCTIIINNIIQRKGMRMSKFSDPFAEVVQEAVEVGGDEVAKVGVRVKDDDGIWRLAGIQHSSWQLIKNSVAKDVGDNIMSRSPYAWKELKVLWDGKKYAHYFITETPVTQIEVGDQESDMHRLHLGMMMRNAYDGSGKFGMEMFACDYACTNQFVSRKRFGYFAIYHNETNEWKIDDALESIETGASNLIAVAPRIQELANTDLSSGHIIEAYKETKIPHSKWGDVIERLAVEQATMFGLYSALTYIASHQLRGFNAISVGDSITEHMLGVE